MDGADERTMGGARRAPEGSGPSARSTRWSWVLLGTVAVAGIAVVAWAIAGRGGGGAVLPVGIGAAVVLGSLLVRGGPVLAAAWFRRGDRRRGA